MRDAIDERIIQEANYLIENNATIRATAKAFGMSKSNLHLDVTRRLFRINKSLCRKVRAILAQNYQERAVRGGVATQKKYKEFKKKGADNNENV